ncbi:hypothetical protein BACCAP_00525 [Pseudoflavonifractor capillosus ATCC 29799]|uniref:Uncharacterized protein n=1 Tax=Pseudoflavonifractor capillosus ATCC 29799 TaxID=411467 RepID=A6NQQ5_9FIRM|nr:hypothetical protein BACCAP_00525 [Pseudoflavonifractor capillosus ATCC 29799]
MRIDFMLSSCHMWLRAVSVGLMSYYVNIICLYCKQLISW